LSGRVRLVAFGGIGGGVDQTDTGKTREKPRKDQRKAKDLERPGRECRLKTGLKVRFKDRLKGLRD
jgi:hypothetical protein